MCICETVSTEDLKYCNCASSASCNAESGKKVMLVQNILWLSLRQAFSDYLWLRRLSGQGGQGNSICLHRRWPLLTCLLFSDSKGQTSASFTAPHTSQWLPAIQVPKLDIDPKLLTTQDYQCPNDNLSCSSPCSAIGLHVPHTGWASDTMKLNVLKLPSHY